MAACASRSMSGHVYEATAWPVLKKASIPVAMPHQSSTIRSGLSGWLYIGMSPRDEGGSWVTAWCGACHGVSLGGVGGVVSAGQLGIGLDRLRSPVSVVAPRDVCD